MTRTRIYLAILVLLIVGSVSAYSKSKEEAEGMQQAMDFEKTATFVTDAKVNERVDRIGRALAAVANKTEISADYGSCKIDPFEYHFKVIDSDDINAFSIQGGYIYVYKGLLDFVQSDDELAGVLAHEVAHSAHHHQVALMRKQSKLSSYIALVALAGGLSKMDGTDLANLLSGVQMFSIAKLMGYGQEAEFDADKTGTLYAIQAGYNPSGILEFITRLIDYQEERGEVRNYGIYQTHPNSQERACRVAGILKSRGVAVDMRKIEHLAEATIEPCTINGQRLWKVNLAGKQVCAVVDSGDLSSRQRCEQIRDSINEILKTGFHPKDVKIKSDSCELLVGEKVVVKVESTDCCALGNKSTDELLDAAAETLRYAAWSDWLKTECSRIKPGE